MWDEGTAGRGADEIGSCLLKHFQRHDIQGEKLIAISKLSYTFPQVGHVMLPSDCDFGVVEKYV